MPNSFGVPSVPRTLPLVRSFKAPSLVYPYAITGVTLDSAGVALASCLVHLFRTADDTLAGLAISDANGLYLIPASNSLNHYAVAYKAGSPDVAGTTVNTLTGA